MKKVLVHGYTMNNLGDDLFFRVLTNRYPHVQFYLPTTNSEYKKILSDIPNLTIIDFLGISKITKHQIYKLPKLYSKMSMERFDAVVCIGGSLFIDRKNPTNKDQIETEKYSFINDWEYAKNKKIPYFLLGVNWGPCYNDYFFKYFNQAFDSLFDIYFRDNYSYRLFTHKPNVRGIGDLLMANKFLRSCVNFRKKKKQISISVIDVQRKNELTSDESFYEQGIVDIYKKMDKLNYDVLLLSFCESEGDCKAAERIRSRAPNARIVKYTNNWKEMLQIIADSELIIASRFHAVVLGWTLYTKVYSLAYSEKIIHLMNDCGLPNACKRISEMKDLSIDEILENAGCPKDIEKYSGEKAFLYLDKLLKKTERKEKDENEYLDSSQ